MDQRFPIRPQSKGPSRQHTRQKLQASSRCTAGCCPLFAALPILHRRDQGVASEGVKVSLYADDIAVWAQSRDKNVVLSKVQETITNFGIWSEEHKLTLNASKCETSFFSTDTKEAGWCPEVRLNNGVTLPINRTLKFLGIACDCTLTFRPHVEDVKSKVLGRMLASLASKEWGWSRGRICLAMINSVLNYCGAAWLAKTNVLILERVQNRALRVFTRQILPWNA